jgi:hypothetical protein
MTICGLNTAAPEDSQPVDANVRINIGTYARSQIATLKSSGWGHDARAVLGEDERELASATAGSF